MTEHEIWVELDDNGDVVRLKPAVAVVEIGDTVTYYLSTKDGTDWRWDGFLDPSLTMQLGGRTLGPGETPGMCLIVGERTESRAETSITLLYKLTIRDYTPINGGKLKKRKYHKSTDPVIVFR